MSSFSSKNLACSNSFTIPNEDYAILAGVLGGFLLLGVYLLIIKVIDCVNKEEELYESQTVNPPFSNLNKQQMEAEERARRTFAPCYVPEYSSCNNAVRSPRLSSQRRVRFDDAAIKHTIGSFSSEDMKECSGKQEINTRFLSVGREESNGNDMRYCCSIGDSCEDVFSPLPRPPARW